MKFELQVSHQDVFSFFDGSIRRCLLLTMRTQKRLQLRLQLRFRSSLARLDRILCH